MKRLMLLALIAPLAACGMDGAPMRPEKSATATPGVSVSGDAIAGMRYDTKK